MSQYVSYEEFINSPYGTDYAPSGSIFETSGQVNQFLTFISGLIDVYCGRSFEPTIVEHNVEGYGQQAFFLGSIPVSGIVEFTYQNISGSSTGAVSNNYMLDRQTGRVKMASPLQPGLYYTVRYSTGYSEVPDAIKMATLMLANTYAQAIDTGAVGIADGGAVTSFKFAKFAEQYSDPRQKNPQFDQGIPVTVEAILRKFRYLR